MWSSNVKIGKLPLFSTLRFVKRKFSFQSFSIFCFQFVPSVYSYKETILCISHLQMIDRISRSTSLSLDRAFKTAPRKKGTSSILNNGVKDICSVLIIMFRFWYNSAPKIGKKLVKQSSLYWKNDCLTCFFVSSSNYPNLIRKK